MEAVIGSSLPVFIGVTLVLMGFCAYMTGRALAMTWRPVWHAVPYGMLLAAASRFLKYGLYDGELISFTGYVVDAVVLVAIAMIVYRAYNAMMMVKQYPWAYERAGIFGWREKGGAAG